MPSESPHLKPQATPSPTEESARIESERPLLPALAILAITAILLATRALEMTGDSLSYAQQASSGENLFHPHHLIFTGAVRMLYLAMGQVTGHWDALLAAQIHNLIFLAIGLFSVYGIARRQLESPRLGLAAMVLWAGTSGVWLYTTQAEVYIPAIVCLTAATAALLRETSGRHRGLWIIGWWTLGVLYHQTSVLWAVPLGLYFLARRRVRRAIFIMATAGTLTLLAYIAAFLIKDQKGLSFLEFCLFYVQHGPPAWGATSNLGWAGLVNLATSQWKALTTVTATPWILGLLGLWIAGVTVLAALSWNQQKPGSELLRFSVAWYLTYGLFFWWWLPTEVEFCVLMAMPLLLATLGAMARLPLTWAGALVTVGTLLSLLSASHGFREVVLPRHQSPGADHAFALSLYEGSDEGKCLVLARHRTLTTFRYYFLESRRSSFEVTRAFQMINDGQADKVSRRRTECLVLEARELLASRSFHGSSSRKTPKRWLAFVEWLFETAPCTEGEPALCSESFRWVRASNDRTVLQIGPGARSAGTT